MSKRSQADLKFAKVDLERVDRCGIPEVIYGQGKTAQQIIKIAKTLLQEKQPVLITRVTPAIAQKVTKSLPKSVYHREAAVISQGKLSPSPGKIAVCAAGTSDLPVSEEAAICATYFGNTVTRHYDIGVAGIHRLMGKIEEIRKADVIIAVAGMEGALPSVLAGLVDKPLIAVPTSIGYGANLGGITALCGMLTSCGSGVTTVNIDNGFGAAYAATQITRLIQRSR